MWFASPLSLRVTEGDGFKDWMQKWLLLPDINNKERLRNNEHTDDDADSHYAGLYGSKEILMSLKERNLVVIQLCQMHEN